MANVVKVRPRVAFRVIGAIIIYFPWMAASMIASMNKLSVEKFPRARLYGPATARF